MAKANTSSVDTANGDRIAAFGTQQKAAMKAGFKPSEVQKKEQVVNAKKAENISAKKTKMKKRAKLAKISRKKNKK